MKRLWNINSSDSDLKESLSKELGLLPITAQLLLNRGINSVELAQSYLTPDLNNIHDPFLLKDMDKAVARLIKAFDDKETVALYGDYDVDGTTSTALLTMFFSDIGIKTISHIPERLIEGYGMNKDAMKLISDNGASIVITADCGVSNAEEIEYANSLGLDCIITDHHELPEGILPAYALLNPKRPDCTFPFKGLAGVGVAFNLVMALRTRLREVGKLKDAPNLKRYLDIVTIGTVADMVPLIDENRIFVHYGLKEINNNPRVGVKALMDVSGVKQGEVKTDSIGFKLAPRINAAGRLDKASTALNLLIETDERRAIELAEELDRENSLRRQIEQSILDEVFGMIESGEYGSKDDKAVVLYKEGWHQGVIGIVASRVVRRYNKPCVMIAIDDDGVGKGSIRGVNSVDMLEGLRHCDKYLDKYGGHKAAAGLTIEKNNLEEFKKEFISFMNTNINDKELTPTIELDGEIAFGDINSGLVGEIEKLAPFGQANKEPVLCVKEASVKQTTIVGTNHLKVKVGSNGSSIDAIGFGMGDFHPLKGPVDVAFSPYIDTWKGQRNLKLIIKDIKTEGKN